MSSKALKVLILTGPGTNCDAETVFAFNRLGCKVTEKSLRVFSGNPGELESYEILVLPGGFTYGDYLGAGTLYASDLKHTMADEITEFISNGKFIIGICNGFQILAKCGLLPALEKPFEDPSVTLEVNKSLRFEDRWIYLKPEGSSFWTKKLPKLITLPVAHAEGRFTVRDKKVLRLLETNGQIILRYATNDGTPPRYPANPNGSEAHIAAITDKTGQIMGMMPHPERFMLAEHHPSHTRGNFSGEPHGALLLSNLVNEARSRFS